MNTGANEKVNNMNEKLEKEVDDKIKIKIDYGNPVKNGMVSSLAVVGGVCLAGAAIYGIMALVNGPVIEDISFNNSPNNWI